VKPFRTIASLKLFATLLCVVTFGDTLARKGTGRRGATGRHGQLGNTFAVTMLTSSKFPLVVILAELAAQLSKRNMAVNLGGVPRDQNEEADALTNGDFASFDAKLRVNFDVTEISWLILPRMLEVAEQIYEKVRRSDEWRFRRL
jgi:hypothetical protein